MSFPALQSLLEAKAPWKDERLKGCKCSGPLKRDVNPKCPIHGVETIKEGFSGFSVNDSDTAADLWYTIEEKLPKLEKKIRKETGGIAPDVGIQTELAEAVIKLFRKEMKDDDGDNEFNTHATLNVAMIMCEKLKEFRTFKVWKNFAAEIARELRAELKSEPDRYNKPYAHAMTKRATQLESFAK